MEKQMKFVEALFENLLKNLKVYISNEKKARGALCWDNYQNRDHGKCALKRKITMIRQELLNLEKMLDSEDLS